MMMVLPEEDAMVLPEENESESHDEADVVSILPKPSAKDAEKEMRTKLLLVEDQNVRNARSIVIIAGIFCASAVGVAVNIFAHQNETDSFELQVRKSGRRRNHPCLLAFGKDMTNPIRYRAHHSVQWLRC
jgi:hypothetical protein